MLYKVYNKTTGKYARNKNRNNPYYLTETHAKRGLKQYQWRHPEYDYEIHSFELTFSGVVA